MNKVNFIFFFKNNKYIFSIFVVVLSAFFWLFSNNFVIDEFEKGYDSFRYLYHALNGCSVNFYTCEMPIIRLLGALGNDTTEIYINYLLLIFIFLVISISKKLLPYLFYSLPILIYFMGQPGKDGFTIVGSIALLSILNDLDFSQFRFSILRPTLNKKYLINVFRFSIILISVYLRFKFWSVILVISILFFLVKNSDNSKSLKKNFKFLVFFFLIIVISIYRLKVFGLENFLFHTSTIDMSNFGSERYSFLVGAGVLNYIYRFIFYFIFPLLNPVRIIIDLLLFKSNAGFITLLGILILIQNFILYKNKILLNFFYFSIPILALISIFIFPHLRYYLIFFPALIIITLMNKNNNKKVKIV